MGPTRFKNTLFIGNGEIFLLSAENTRGMAATVSTTGFHDYVIDVNTSTGAVQVQHDGVPALTGSLFTTPSDTTTDYVVWGDISSFAFGQSEWTRFSHDAYLFCAPESRSSARAPRCGARRAGAQATPKTTWPTSWCAASLT